MSLRYKIVITIIVSAVFSIQAIIPYYRLSAIESDLITLKKVFYNQFVALQYPKPGVSQERYVVYVKKLLRNTGVAVRHHASVVDDNLFDFHLPSVNSVVNSYVFSLGTKHTLTELTLALANSELEVSRAKGLEEIYHAAKDRIALHVNQLEHYHDSLREDKRHMLYFGAFAIIWILSIALITAYTSVFRAISALRRSLPLPSTTSISLLFDPPKFSSDLPADMAEVLSDYCAMLQEIQRPAEARDREYRKAIATISSNGRMMAEVSSAMNGVTSSLEENVNTVTARVRDAVASATTVAEEVNIFKSRALTSNQTLTKVQMLVEKVIEQYAQARNIFDGQEELLSSLSSILVRMESLAQSLSVLSTNVHLSASRREHLTEKELSARITAISTSVSSISELSAAIADDISRISRDVSASHRNLGSAMSGVARATDELDVLTTDLKGEMTAAMSRVDEVVSAEGKLQQTSDFCLVSLGALGGLVTTLYKVVSSHSVAISMLSASSELASDEELLAHEKGGDNA